MKTPNDSNLLTAEAKRPMNRRLSILDLMMGMAVVAVTVVLEQNLPNGHAATNCKEPFWFGLFFSHAVASKALVLFGMLMLGRAVLASRKSGGKCIWNPGHVLMLSQFLFFSDGAVKGIMSDSSVDLSYGGVLATILLFLARNGLSMTAVLATLAAAVIGGAVFRWNWIWVTSLSLLSLSGTLVLASNIYVYYFHSSPSFAGNWELFSMVMQFNFLITCACVFAAATYDLVKGNWRDMPHWIGVTCWFVGTLMGYFLYRTALLVLTPAELYGY